MQQSWQQIIIEAHSSDEAEKISELLEFSDALSVTFQDAQDEEIFEPEIGATPLWKATQVIALYTADTNVQPVIDLLKNSAEITQPVIYQLAPLPEQNWSQVWMKDFHPLQFADNLWICPSWCEPKDPQAINIKLDPGLAFGTGTHPTTALCLQWLATQQNQLADKIIIDYGCGSGILAIAALLLGAKQVVGVDIDPQAIIATKENAKQNNLNEQQLIAVLTDQIELPLADILIANILANPLIELAEKFSKQIKKNGLIVLSGIIESQLDNIINHYQQWFEIIKTTSQENWYCVVGKKM